MLIVRARAAYASVKRFLQYIFLELATGIDTAKPVALKELGIDVRHRVDYEPSPLRPLRRVLPRHEVSSDDVFLDFGCGKGRVLLHAASYPFKRVMGVELSDLLADIARRNVDKSLRRLECKDVKIVTADAVDYDVPDDVTVAFFNNPFQDEVFGMVVDKLVASLRKRSRKLRIIYMNADEEEQLLRAGAVLVRTIPAFRPTRSWALKSGTRMYSLNLGARR